ncbi:MAG: glutamate 5-kinase [Candidatus Melainabacteria bacterium HGW-Melainabacteria-1]|nr:MAG: glutamate 5-kinase [Candidatus Melainabacteria bacterium HGW-Melainabacteria-1]
MKRRIVVKLGTSVLTAGTDRLNHPRLVDLCRQIAWLMDHDFAVTLVSSGAVLAGWEHLGFPPRKRTLAEKQLLAAVGQSQLMHLYTQLAGIYGLKVAQTLLIRSDFSDRRRYLNARTTFEGCFERNLLPIVNENDVVAIDEIKVGDNDTLAAYVASLVEAEQLIICSDIDGLYTAAPQTDPEAQLIETVPEIDDSLWQIAGGVGSNQGTGGMVTKIQAADIATKAGIGLRIVSGSEPNVLIRLAQGEAIGTWFVPRIQRLEARKRWILAETVMTGRLVVDAGASAALLEQGRSLLAAGVVQVEGEFEKGQTVRIYDQSGRELARGLSRYGSDELIRIQGRKSDEITAILGYAYGPVIHRNDLVSL